MTVRVDFDVEMKTRDGVILRADVFRPETDEPVPAILARTPYNKALKASRIDGFTPSAAARRGYAFVVQDVRGRWASEGDYLPISKVEGPDGYDCIEWVADQEWCSGAVGMVGGSYESLAQFMAAEEQPPGLKAIIPEFTGDARMGALMLDSIMVGWAAGQALDALQKKIERGLAQPHEIDVVRDALRDPQTAARHLPLQDMPIMTLDGLFTYREMIDILRAAAGIRFDSITVPALIVSGWWDMTPGDAVEFLRLLRTTGGSDVARADSAIVIGPWEHCMPLDSLGERFFGAQASAVGRQLPELYFGFFDRHLRGSKTPSPPVASYFVTGDNEWRESLSWPPPGVVDTELFLDSGGAANSRNGDGVLSWDRPGADVGDSFAYDPATPVPSHGGRYFRVGGSRPGPYDQTRVEERDDVLVYTSPPLDRPLTLAGDLELTLFASSSAVDTDFVVKLCDVAPDGLSHNVADRLLRARWRGGYDEPRFLTPNEVTKLSIALGPIGHTVKANHRLRLQVTSSAFPAFERNMNTGNLEGTDAIGVVAEQTVFHGPAHPSALRIPMLQP